MIRNLFFLLFMIPLRFIISFWFYQYLFFIIIFIFLINFNFSFVLRNISFIFGLDLTSYFLTLLSYWICTLIIIARFKVYKNLNYDYIFLFLINLLIISLYITFVSLNLFSFYFFFEFRIIPTLILIIGWGYQPERIEAGIYLLFYTIIFSMPMIVGIFFIYNINFSLFFFSLKFSDSLILYLCLNLVFFVKIPIFFFHLWLPKAHVEAPVSGSIILAGVILKLGGYGLIRLIKIFSPIWFSLNLYFIIIRLIGGLIVSLICLRQSDIKSLIAYSSVSHIGLALCGILTIRSWGIRGSYVLILAHGLCSSGLFCLSNLNYERLSRRRLYLNKGIIRIIPSLSFWWFIFCVLNIAAPPSLNLMGEIFLINRLIIYNRWTIIFLSLISFFGAVYSLFLFSYVQHGFVYSGIFRFFIGCRREYLLIFLHFFPLVFLVLKGDLIILYSNSLIKILVCGSIDVFSLWIIICKIFFFFFLLLSLIFFWLRIYFSIIDFSLVYEYNLFNYNSIFVNIVFIFDNISLLFMRFVLFISSIVILYRNNYMEGDLNLDRFIFLVVIFVFSMIMLIISPNLIRILLGWDGLGLVSYCLVIYYQNVKSYNAGMLTALTNRIGDVGLLISIAWIINYGSWNYIFYLKIIYNDYCFWLISLFIVLAAITKSAQIPFSSWLPAAIAAPTPVSALVHSSTLVTAGIYLLIRFFDCFSLNLMNFILFFSIITIFISGLGANFEFDLKKIIALSTLSQLGLIIRILSLGSLDLAFFHLLTHALFKALLFICAGLIIHNFINMQDIRFFGGLVNHIPLTVSLIIICNFSLCGLPFLSGFYSKDLIVEVISMNYMNIFVYLVFYLSVGLTVCYSFRLCYYLLFGSYNFISIRSIIEINSLMLKGILGLIFLVIMIGSILTWTIFISPYFVFLPFVIKLMALIIIFFGVYFGVELFKISLNLHFSSKFIYLKFFLGLIWNIPLLSTVFVYKDFIFLGGHYLKIFDQGWKEYYGSYNIKLKFSFLGSFLQFLSINHLKIYFILLVLLFFLFIIYFYLNSLNRV